MFTIIGVKILQTRRVDSYQKNFIRSLCYRGVWWTAYSLTFSSLYARPTQTQTCRKLCRQQNMAGMRVMRLSIPYQCLASSFRLRMISKVHSLVGSYFNSHRWSMLPSRSSRMCIKQPWMPSGSFCDIRSMSAEIFLNSSREATTLYWRPWIVNGSWRLFEIIFNSVSQHSLSSCSSNVP